MATTPFVGEMMIAAFGFAPRGWTGCAGQLLPIQQNQALFSLLGTNYGGDGVTTFGLPNLQGRVAIGQGTSSFGTPFPLGTQGGSESVTLNQSQLPAHIHAATIAGAIPCSDAAADTATPVGHGLAAEPAGVTAFYADALSAGSTMASGAVAFTGTLPPATQVTGGSQPHENRQPFLTLNVCIALTGIFPSRN